LGAYEKEEICLKEVLLAKNQNLSNQLDSLKDTNTRLIDYVKSINKKVGTVNSEKEFSEITENNKSRKIKEFKSKAETELWLHFFQILCCRFLTFVI
jgi:hypothetical protein